MMGARRAKDLVVRALSDRMRSTNARSGHVVKAFCKPSASRPKPSSVKHLLGTLRSILWIVEWSLSSPSLSLAFTRSFLGVRTVDAGNLKGSLVLVDDLMASRCFLSARFSRSDAIDLPSLGPDDVRCY